MSAELSFTNYTAAAEACVLNASREATTLQHAQVQPEHLLLTLLAPESGTAWNLLAGTLRNPAMMQEGLRIVLADALTTAENTPPVYGFRIKRTLSEAEEEAQRAGHVQVDTGHLLLGLLNEGGAAGQMLRRSGFDAAKLRHWLRQPQPLAPVSAPIASQPSAPPVRPPTMSSATPPQPRTRDERLILLESQPLKKLLPRLISWPALIVMLGTLIISIVLMGQDNFDLSRAGLVVFVLDSWIISLCAHEFGHALLADLGGDRSVRGNGYLSFNPLKYTHPLLSIIMPLLFMMMGGIGLPGGAVYIQTARLRGPKWQSAVSFAGPAASALMAILFSLPFVLRIFSLDRYFDNPLLWEACSVVVYLNCAAVVLNLLPIPPLDGFGILAPFLSANLRALFYSFSMFGFLLIFMLFAVNPAIRTTFQNLIDSMLRTLNVAPLLVDQGFQMFMFWRQ
jgi:Zn-dependent protease